MFIDGHKEILNEVLSEYFDNKYFSEIDHTFNNVTYDNFLLGIKLVDLPCSTYDIDPSKQFFNMSNKKLCKLNKFLSLLSLDSAKSQLYQFHKGFFSHLHAMSTDPENTVAKIRSKIIFSSLGYCLLSIFDDTLMSDDKLEFKPNSIWIGMVEHIITDSYGVAHTLRKKRYKYKAIKKRIVSEEEKESLKKHQKVKDIAKVINPIITSEKEFKSKFSFNNVHKYWKLYKVFRFEYDLQQKVTQWFPMHKILNAKGATGIERYGDIVNFQHAPSQSVMRHSLNDFLYIIRSKKTLYHRMKSECAQLLKYYNEVLKTRNVKAFLKNVYSLLLNRTFRINKRYLDDKTHFLDYKSV